MRLLWLTERYYPRQGGMAQACDRIVHGLRSAGIDVDIVHLDTRLRRWERKRQLHGWYLACPVGRDHAHALQRAWLHVQTHVATHRPTHVVAFGGNLALQAGPIYAAWLDLPLITLLRGNDWDIGLFHLQRRPHVIFALERSAAVCVVSQIQQQQIQALLPQVEIHSIANGIDAEQWQILPSQHAWANTWRESYAQGKPVIGLFGHLKPKKGIEFFLHALYSSGYADQVHLLFAGTVEPTMFGRLMRYPHFHVWYEPFLQHYDLVARYTACDLVAIPSFYDGMPNVLLEVGVLGKPVIAAAAGGIADVIPDSDWLFEPGNPQGCIATIRHVLSQDSAAHHIAGQQLQQRITSHFTQHQETAAYRTLFETTGTHL